MELKRVLLNKKMILLLLAVTALSVGIYLNAQFRSASQNNYDLIAANAYRNELIAELKQEDFGSAKIKIDDKLAYYSNENIELIENNTKYRALCELSSQLDSLIAYPDYLAGIEKQAEQMNAVSIFSDMNSLSKINIEKTVKDYAKLKSVSLSLVNDKPISTVLDFKLVHFLTLIFLIAVVFSFLDERKRGLWSVVYSTSGGRFKLALRRAGVLLAGTALANIVCVTAVFVAAFALYGGAEDLFASVQSIELFKSFTFAMSEFEFIIFYTAMCILAQYALALTIWLAASLFRNAGLALGAIAAFFAAGYIFYSALPDQSNFAFLRYVNSFFFTDVTQAIIKYNNINFFFTVINTFWLVFYSAIFISIILIAAVASAAEKSYPEKSPNKIEAFLKRFTEKLKRAYWKAVERLGIFGTELYKLLVIQKGFLIILCFALLLFSSVDAGKIYYSGSDEIAKSFYNEYSGAISSSALEYIENLEGEMSKSDKELEQKYSEYAVGKITAAEFETAQLKYNALGDKREALGKIKERVEYINELKEQNEEAWLLDYDGYRDLLGESSVLRRQVYSILSILCVILLLSGVFSFEHKSLMYASLHASCFGRSSLFGKKIFASTLISLSVSLITAASLLYSVLCRHTLSNLNAPIKSLEFMNGLPFNISIGAFLMLAVVMQFLLLLAVSYTVCLFSALFKFEICLAVSLVTLAVPSLLYLMGLNFLSCISVCIPLSATDFAGANGYAFLIPVIIILTAGAVNLIFAKRIWCRESRRKNEA